MENKIEVIKDFNLRIIKAVERDEDGEIIKVPYHHIIENEVDNVHDMLAFCISISCDVLKNRISLNHMPMDFNVEQDDTTDLAVEKLIKTGGKILEDYYEMRKITHDVLNKKEE